MILATVDSKGVKIALENLNLSAQRGMPKALFDTALEVLRLSQFEVPHDEGTLQNSGTVEYIGTGVVLGYHTPYAARLHEHPEYHFQRGRKGKYIEDPINHNLAALGLEFGSSLQTRMF